MQRYQQTAEIITASQQKRRYSTIYYPKFPKKTSDTYIVGKRSDRLDLLAFTYYNDPRLYWVIQKANNIPYGSFMIPPGTILRIPNLSQQEIDNALANKQLGY